MYPNSDLEYLASLSFSIETFTPQMARLKYGVLLQDILSKFKNKTESKLVPDRTMWVYSAHDSTLSGLLNILQLFTVSSVCLAMDK